MTVYFCLNDVLDRLEGETDFHALSTVSTTPLRCDGYTEDAFELASSPKIVNLADENAPHQLAGLLKDAPLYQMNMELALDSALAERHKNASIRKALERAFAGQPLPNTLSVDDIPDGDVAGNLRHPMLGHISAVELCTLYLDFINALGPDNPHFSFAENILGAHEKRFAHFFDGFISGGGGRVRSDILLGFGQRSDHDSGRPMEDYITGGQREALKMRIEEPQELLWAWNEADYCQMRRCRDIDRVRNLKGLPRQPNWLRNDVFTILEKEAMKQTFAQTLGRADAKLGVLKTAPLIRKAVEANISDQVDENLRQMIAEVLNNSAYTGSAGKFQELALRRRKEAQKARLI